MSWNEFPLALVIGSNGPMRTAPVGTWPFAGGTGLAWEIVSAAMVLAVLLFAVVQQRIIVTAGASKS